MGCYYPELPSFEWKNKYYYIGLTGAIGSGKSTVANLFLKCGAKVFDADTIAKSILHSRKMRPKLQSVFGDSIFDADSNLDNSKIASLVFSDQNNLKKLNEMIHPEVQNYMTIELQKVQAGEVCIYDIPLLFESSKKNKYDCTIVISASQKIRQKRVKVRNNWDADEFLKRENRQLPLVEKEKLADLVINNEGEVHDLEVVINSVYNAIQSQKK